jgi:hypothetical protein
MLAPDQLPMAHEFEHEDDRDQLDPYIDGVVPTPITPEESGFLLGMLIVNLRRIHAAYDEDGEDLSALPAKAADEIERLIAQEQSDPVAVTRCKYVGYAYEETEAVLLKPVPYDTFLYAAPPNLTEKVAELEADVATLEAVDMAPCDECERLEQHISELTKQVSDAEAMADVGRALINAIEVHAYPGWGPAECPSEIVGDLRNECDELRAELKKTESIRVELEKQRAYAYDLSIRVHDLQSLVYQYKRDADLYRMLRNEDEWGEDTASNRASAWQLLGELSGAAFDDFVSTRFALRGAA